MTMKKFWVLLLTLVVACVQSQAQLLQGDGFEANKGYEIGLLGGAFGIYDDVSCAGIGFNGTIYGAYVDLLFWPRAHSNTTDVDKHENEKETFSVHAGYQFPLTKWLSIIPVIGYTSVTTGTTDGSKWSYNKSSGIRNSYSVEDKTQGFDYGGALCINIKSVRLYAVGTRYGIYGGIGLAW